MLHKIVLKEFVSEDLALRDSVDRLFDYVESLDDAGVTFDFKGVESITRSFAHQYRVRKQASLKNIVEVRVPENVSRMFGVVAEPVHKTPLIDLRRLKVVTLNPA
ncbi:MAG: hypothetical protein V1834_00215 [Candidatus Micrarchaeota archaeon]